MRCERYPLPDHRHGRSPELHELQRALELLRSLRSDGEVVLVHCVAGVERSPLLVLAWLIDARKLSFTSALDYLMEVHPGTNPLPGQLAVLRELVRTDQPPRRS